LIGAEGSLAKGKQLDGTNQSIAALTVEAVHKSMCALSPQERVATYEALQGIKSGPLFNAELGLLEHQIQIKALAALSRQSATACGGDSH
jgi:hypothetical protein